MKAMFKCAVPEAIDYLIRVVEDSKAKTMDRIKAAEIIIDHGIGKASQEVQITGEKSFNIVFDSVLKDGLGKS
jgi:hypothetical protein